MFLKAIALTFLIVFLIKLINPKIYPYLKNFIKQFYEFLKTTGRLIIYSFSAAIKLLFKRTVYVVSIVIISSLIFNTFVIIYVIHNFFTFNLFFTLFTKNLFDIYVLAFFTVTYVLGILEVLKETNKISTKFYDYFKHKIYNLFDKKGKYFYDEKTNRYTYRK